jgi:hypothetical protein
MILARAASEKTSREAELKPFAEAGVGFGPWHCVGPFKDALFGLFSRSFAEPFGPEVNMSANGALDSAGVFHSVSLPGDEPTARRWEACPQWRDGYWCAMPAGPSPGRNEVVYACRTITANKDMVLHAELFALDAARVWLNGKEVGRIYGKPVTFMRAICSARFDLPLAAGENRLLVKVVAYHGSRGFALAMPPLTPTRIPGANPIDSRDNLLQPGYEPYASGDEAKLRAAESPAGYEKKSTWHDTLLAWAENPARNSQLGFKPFAGAVLGQKDGAQSVRVNIAGLKELWLLTGDGGDGTSYDDAIWADPKLITKDQKTIWLTDLKPVTAQAGENFQLFVNSNHAGKPLEIGGRKFERGFWAHANSAIQFALPENCEWFEASIGLDSLAQHAGSASFRVERRDDRATQQLIWQALARDFTDRDSRREMAWEQSDRIWDVLPTGTTATLCARYVEAIQKLFPGQAVDLKPAAVAQLRAHYLRAKRFDAALRTVRAFHFDVDPVPIYDPPALKMCELLDAAPATPRAAAYLNCLAELKRQAQAALQQLDAGKPDAVELIIAAADSLEQLWQKEIASLGPIVFLRRGMAQVNVVSPYDATAPSPAEICVLDPTRPHEPPRIVHREEQGSIYDLNISYDARTIFFSARRPGVAGGWHIYRIGADGSDLRQITAGDCNDISPLLLPGGDILFVSDRAGSYLVCQAPKAGHIYACDPAGGNVRRISGNTLSDHTPQILNDGRVLFTRWDYGVNVNVFTRQALWSMCPDGSQLSLYYGNTIEDPAGFYQARAIPDRPEIICTFGPHHLFQAGSLGMVWNDLGLEAPRGQGLRWVSRELPITDDVTFPHGYQQPFPVNERQFLASWGGDGQQRNRLYLIDDRGNKRCIFGDDSLGCWWPMLLTPRPVPPVIPARTSTPAFVRRPPLEANATPDEQWGTLVLTDVYKGLPKQVQRGEIKAIQIMEQVPKTHPKTAPEAWGDSPIVGRGTYYVRRLVGTVPVEPDGSAHFLVPAVRDISLNALDAEGRAIQMMKTTFSVMPGEVTGCVGCHEHTRTPTDSGAPPRAAQRAPDRPRQPDWGTAGIIDYPRVVQPVMDKYCVKCHSGPTPKKGVDLSGDITRYFNMSYNTLVDRGLVFYGNLAGEPPMHATPKAFGAYVSGIRKFIETDHAGAVLPAEARQRIYTWIDADIPYYGTYAHTSGNTALTGFRDRWYVGTESDWFRKDFLPGFEKRCVSCHLRTVDCTQPYATAPINARVTSRLWPDNAYMSYFFGERDPLAAYCGPDQRVNLTHPEWSQMLTAPLAKQAGGLGLCKDKDGAAVFKDVNDADYQAMLQALQKGGKMLELNPRVDMLPQPDPAKPEAYAPGLPQP